MSYQVLARKYRPKRFAEVVGQLHVTQTLQNALKQGRLHHAYLFTGVRGVGKTTVARILAKGLNCEKSSASPGDFQNKMEPCDACPACLEIAAGRSLDVQEIDGASNTGVDDVRQIREQAKYLPATGKYKIYIIDEVHMLSTSAFNALLKTLEEPPPHVVFIFATTEPHKIPATILSRCQRHDFRRISASALADALKEIAASEKVEISEEALHLIAHEACGSLRDGQSLLDQAIAFSGNKIDYENLKGMLGFLDRSELFSLLEAILTKDRKTALDQCDRFYQTGNDLNRLAQDLLANIKNLLLIRSLEKPPEWLEAPKGEIEKLVSLSKRASLEELDQLFQLAYEGVEGIAKAAFPKMVFEVLLVRMTQVDKIIPLGKILGDLETHRSPALPLTTKERSFEWDDFVSWLQKEKPQLASIIKHGEMVSFETKGVTLAFEEGSLYGEMLQEEDRKGQFEGFLLKFFGQAVPSRIVSKVSAAVSKESGEASLKKNLRESALRSEPVREATNILGAIVEEVRIPSENK